MESVHYTQFIKYIRRLQDDLECFVDDLQENKGDVDLHDYSFNFEPLNRVLSGKTFLLGVEKGPDIESNESA